MPGLAALSQLAHAAQEGGSYLARAARMMVGVPDYGQYVAHMRRTHPEDEPLSYEEFFKNRMQARYGGGRPGCC
ncbi:MAG: YbdD/YjiX family protein [Proteobacteria bacterium]|nr:YbdD/YjiX family protein [Pseudomonadota bacterium]MBS0494560.1 YbdD/YjiX family protein [Pseudomonadota bacterium]